MPGRSRCVCEICGNRCATGNEFSFHEKMTEWLDNNPSFTWRYFNEKNEALSSDPWMEIGVHEEDEECIEPRNSPSSSSQARSIRRTISQASVPGPIRKLSDYDFADYKKIVSSSADGKPTFIPLDTQINNDLREKSQQGEKSPTSPALSHAFLQYSPFRRSSAPPSDERELITELIMDVCNELDITSLCFKILQNVCTLLNADRGSLFLIERDRVTGQSVLVSKLFDVTPKCSLAESLRHSEKRRVKVPLGVGISGNVAKTGDYANIPDAYADPQFTDAVDRETGYKTKCILCMPIKSIDGRVLAVAQVMNKRTSDATPNEADEAVEADKKIMTATPSFNEHDVAVFRSYVAFCGIGLHNAQIYQKSRLEAYRNQILLELARLIFTEQAEISQLINTVLAHTISLLQCQRCQIVMVHERKSSIESGSSTVRLAQAYNLAWNETVDPTTENSEEQYSLENSHFPVQSELANCVIQSGKTINLIDAASDPRFDASLEKHLEPVWKTHSVLCMPIKHSDGRVLAVCFMVNKALADPYSAGDDDSPTPMDHADRLGVWCFSFSNADEDLFEAFALFAGLGIGNRQMYDRVLRLVAKQRVLLDVLSYHATAPQSEAKALANALIPTVRFYQLDQFSFTDVRLSDECTLKASVRMFLEMRFMRTFKLDMLALCRWILSVKKNYREVTYHNWRHALNVTQTMFAVILNAELQNVFSDVECLALIVACLSHDLDHRGTDNQFQVQTMSPLAELYSTSVLEHHHFNQCMLLLTRKNAELQNVFSDVECLALIVACLSHDLDHRGTDNQFQVQTMSPLAELYSTSVLEHHHFNQCMLLLTRKGNDFLSVLPAPDYHSITDMIRTFILATDLSRYFKNLPAFKQTLEKREGISTVSAAQAPDISWEPWVTDVTERTKLGCMLMTTCDISAITKPWPVQKMVAELVTAEFFEQGDLEKDKLRTQPRTLMDRNNMHDLPKLQVSFIDAVCLPVYQAIVRVSGALQPLLDGCLRNRECWSYMARDELVPDSMFGWTDTTAATTVKDNVTTFVSSPEASHGSPALSYMGTMNRQRAQHIIQSKPFESTPTRRISTVAATTVGGDASVADATANQADSLDSLP